jgi:hypothetical protein
MHTEHMADLKIKIGLQAQEIVDARSCDADPSGRLPILKYEIFVSLI